MMPYEDQKLTVQDSDIYDHKYPSRGPQKNRDGYEFVSVGIDWGNNHWITIYGMKSNGQVDLLKLAHVEKPGATDASSTGKDIQQIRLILAPYNPDIIVADIGDSGDKIAQLMKIYGEDKVFGCRYNSSPKSTGQIVPSWSEANNTVKVDKLMQNKKFITNLKEGNINFYDDPLDRDLQTYVFHWKNVVIREEEDLTTKDFYQVITRKGDDHYAQASVYAMLGWERLQDEFYNGRGYVFDSTFVDNEPGPTVPDIFTDTFR